MDLKEGRMDRSQTARRRTPQKLNAMAKIVKKDAKNNGDRTISLADEQEAQVQAEKRDWVGVSD